MPERLNQVWLTSFAAELQGEKPPVRRLAELHYKASLALQFLHKAQPALEHTQVNTRKNITSALFRVLKHKSCTERPV